MFAIIDSGKPSFRRADVVTSEEVILAWRLNMTHETRGGVIFDVVREYGVYRSYAVSIA
jgi:5'(3')-deoxyribonucleotidase